MKAVALVDLGHAALPEWGSLEHREIRVVWLIGDRVAQCRKRRIGGQQIGGRPGRLKQPATGSGRERPGQRIKRVAAPVAQLREGNAKPVRDGELIAIAPEGQSL